MSDYEEIMNSLVKLRNHCKLQHDCEHCDFCNFCDTNILNTSDNPHYWVFGDEEIICEE